ncbi:S8 family serine peptidase [Candidatus Solirubrobacter pratensis]|uniref:S8 family serine peptidase n=1 Tax=Candidatus Solirubrobacter pratensis TaxID=1298857 RepID=UPI0003FC4ED4|nr:S8 family serine peptidase [Candidatus Solirubrobacter pratensis]
MLDEAELERLLLGSTGWQRYTQDSPVYADVWFGYCGRPERRQDLLLEPHHRAPAGVLAKAVRERLALESTHRLAYAGEYVAAELTLAELLAAVLPLSSWWKDLIRPQEGSVFAHLEAYVAGQRLDPDPAGDPQEVPPPSDELAWLLTVAGRTLTNTSDGEAEQQGLGDLRVLTEEVLDRLGHPTDQPEAIPPLWSVSLNRPVRPTLWRSRETVKADAAGRLFPSDTDGLAWAVIDSGIDARHPAFRRRSGDGRPIEAPADFGDATIVRATYDFTGLRDKIAAEIAGAGAAATTTALQDALAQGLSIDWRLYEPLIAVHHDAGYAVPADPHGTHVAGTIAGDWRPGDPDGPRHPLQGICPGLTLYDLRVLGAGGGGDEFGVLAALSFVRWRNSQSGGTVIHGVNLSFALDHNVLNSACGRSPVCLEAERVHDAGVVVVAAAGNDGRADYTYHGVKSEGYRTVSITDPGNAEAVITVGSTHRIEPHAYGVSYFSSRGPTGDGRAKPDLVAPGEKITAPIPGNRSARMDGTSMAAPHVSGAAALLLARHRELIGRPGEVKRVLCDAATDLGREHHYQGHGMLDILRALQSV